MSERAFMYLSAMMVGTSLGLAVAKCAGFLELTWRVVFAPVWGPIAFVLVIAVIAVAGCAIGLTVDLTAILVRRLFGEYELTTTHKN